MGKPLTKRDVLAIWNVYCEGFSKDKVHKLLHRSPNVINNVIRAKGDFKKYKQLARAANTKWQAKFKSRNKQ